MPLPSSNALRATRNALVAAALSLLAPPACSAQGAGPGPMAIDAGPSACASPGGATSGPANTRCVLDDGGLTVQPLSVAACMSTGDGGTKDSACAYGDTLYGQSGIDDDCKYSVTWSSTPICAGGAGVIFTLKAQFLGTETPVTGAHTHIEYFLSSGASADGASYCDDMTTHLGPTIDPTGGFYEMTQTTEGIYSGQIVFDESGEWTVRFHFSEECFDLSPESPHGHIAFHLTVP